MALPKQRHTRHRRDRARKQYDVKLMNLQKCPKCQAPILAHKVCKECGFYKGRDVARLQPAVAKAGAKKEKK